MAKKVTRFVVEQPIAHKAVDPRLQVLVDMAQEQAKKDRRNQVKHSVRRRSIDDIRSIMN